MSDSRTSLRLYRALLRLYPARFRARFGAELVQLFGDQIRDAGAAPTPFGAAVVWFRGLGDLVVTATAEHLRGDRGVGHPLGEPPTGMARLLGAVGILGGLGILAAFVVQTLIFETLPWLITVRIVLFNIGAIAIIVGLQASAAGPFASRSGTAVAWAAALSNAWYAGMTLLPVIGWAPFAGDHHMVGFLAGLSMWTFNAAFGLVVARRGGFLRMAGTRSRSRARASAGSRGSCSGSTSPRVAARWHPGPALPPRGRMAGISPVELRGRDRRPR